MKKIIMVVMLIVTCQLFNFPAGVVNDNLLLNSGWWHNMDNWVINNDANDSTPVVISDYEYNGNKTLETGLEADIDYDMVDRGWAYFSVNYTGKIIATDNYHTFSVFFICPDEFTIDGYVEFKYVFADGTYQYDSCVSSSVERIGEGYKVKYTSRNSTSKTVVMIEDVCFRISLYTYTAPISTIIYCCQPKLEYGLSATPYCPSIYDNISFDYDKLNASFQSAKIGDFKPLSYHYTKSLTEVGLFNMQVNKSDVYAKYIKPDCLMLYDGDWLLVEDIETDENIAYISGLDLKGLLKTRVTKGVITGSFEGYDNISGSTETCFKTLIAHNIVNPADTNRTIPLATLAKDYNRGLASDNITTRNEELDEVIKKLCENAGIGYDVYADSLNNKIIFDVVDIVDKTIDQRERNQVVFDIGRKNISVFKKVEGVSTYKNFFYCTKSLDNTAEQAAFISVFRLEEGVKSGIARKEKYLAVNVGEDESLYQKANQQKIEYEKIFSFEIQPAFINNYGKEFVIGDKVTLKDGDEFINQIINKVTKSITGNDKSIILSFGATKPKDLKYLSQQIKEGRI